MIFESKDEAMINEKFLRAIILTSSSLIEKLLFLYVFSRVLLEVTKIFRVRQNTAHISFHIHLSNSNYFSVHFCIKPRIFGGMIFFNIISVQ